MPPAAKGAALGSRQGQCPYTPFRDHCMIAGRFFIEEKSSLVRGTSRLFRTLIDESPAHAGLLRVLATNGCPYEERASMMRNPSSSFPLRGSRQPLG